MTQDIDKLAWLHIENRRVLGARSRSGTNFYIPGGKREPGENDEQALIREIREELSVELRPETLALAGTFRAQADGKPEGTCVRMTCYHATFDGTLSAAAEIEDIAWLQHSDRDRCSPVAWIILDRLKEQALID